MFVGVIIDIAVAISTTAVVITKAVSIISDIVINHTNATFIIMVITIGKPIQNTVMIKYF